VPGGESVRAFRRRVTTTVRVLAEAHRCRTLVVTHDGALDMLSRAVQSLPLDGPRDCAIPNGGINRLRWSPDERLLILQWTDDAHLQGLPEQPSTVPAGVASRSAAS